MRVLVSTTSGAGHWIPLLPVARALAEAGHEVVVACPTTAATAIRSRGFEVRPFPEVDGRTPEQLALFARAAETGDQSLAEEAIALGFGYLSPSAAMAELTVTWDSFHPDVVLRDPAEGASAVLAGQHATPSAIAAGGLQSALAWFGSLMAEPVDRLRGEHGLGPTAGAFPDQLVLTATPATFDEPGPDLPVHRFGLGLPHEPPVPTTPPLVYATLGTEVVQQGDLGPRLVAAISDAIALTDALGVLTVGSDPSALGPTHDRLELRSFADHREIVPRARVVLSHGGSGTVQDALHMGRPMVVLPQFADQFLNGERVATLGLGTCLVGDAQNPDAIAGALRLAIDGAHDDAVARVALEAAALPPVAAVVPSLEALAPG